MLYMILIVVCLRRIQKVIGSPGNTMFKAHVFRNSLEAHLSVRSTLVT